VQAWLQALYLLELLLVNVFENLPVNVYFCTSKIHN